MENVKAETPYPFEGMTDDEINATQSDEFADKMFAYYDKQGALLTPEQMDMIEQRWEDERRARRCALIMLTKPFAWLSGQVEKDRDFALAVAEVINNTKDNKFYATTHELLAEAHRRALLASCSREDMKQLLEEASGAS